MEDEAERQGRAGLQQDVGAVEGDAALAVGAQLLLQEAAEVRALPVGPGQRVVRVGQRHQARLERAAEILRRRGGTERLSGDGLDGCEGVFHPVVQLGDQQALLVHGADAVRDVGTFHEDAGNAAVLVRDGLVHEIGERLLQRRVGGALDHEAQPAADEGFAGAVNLVEQLDEALADELGQGVQQWLADDVAVPDELQVGVVDQFEAVVRPAQHAHEAGRLLEEPAEAPALGVEPAVRLVHGLGALEDAALRGRRLGRPPVLGVLDRVAQALEFGDVDRVLQHHRNLAGPVQHRRSDDAPVARLETAALRLRPGNVEAEQRQGVGLAVADHALERSDGLAQRVGVGRERVPGPAPDNVAQLALRGFQVSFVRPDDVQVSVENEVRVRRSVEQSEVVQIRSIHDALRPISHAP
jgi:hypothetical protein